MNIKKNILGINGGAWVAVDTVLERPDLVSQVIVDSFDDRILYKDFASNLLKEREFAKNDTNAKQFIEIVSKFIYD